MASPCAIIYEKVSERALSVRIFVKCREPEVGPTVRRSFVLNIIGNSLSHIWIATICILFPNTRIPAQLIRYWKILVSGQSELNELCVEEPHEFSVVSRLATTSHFVADFK